MRLMSAPMKVGQGTESSLRFIRSKNPRVFALTEMDLGRTTALPVIHKVFGRFAKVYTRDFGGHSQEIPIVVRIAPWVRVHQFDLVKLSNDMGQSVGGMGNDRYLARLEFTVGRRRWVHFATHTNAGVQHVAPGPLFGTLLKNEDGKARWKVFQLQMAQIESHLRLAIDDHAIDVVTVSGDFNMLPAEAGLIEHYSPHRVFKRLGMIYSNTRVNYIAAHGAKIKRVQIFPPGRNGWQSDHSALLAWIS